MPPPASAAVVTARPQSGWTLSSSGAVEKRCVAGDEDDRHVRDASAHPREQPLRRDGAETADVDAVDRRAARRSC